MKSYAEKMIEQSLQTLQKRAKLRDSQKGERSMASCIAGFNALTGNKLTVLQGWIFMLLLKLSRSQQGSYHGDDFLDLIGYSGLTAEEAYLTNKRNKLMVKNKKGKGFKKAQANITKKGGVGKKEAGAILAAATRKAGKAARKKNPNLNKVK